MQQRLPKDGEKLVTIFGPVALDADNTPAALDIRGYEVVELYIGVGIGGVTFSDTDKVEFTLTDADYDDTTGLVGSFGNVSTGEVYDANEDAVTVTSGVIKSLVAAHAAAAVYRFSYVGQKGALKLLANFSGTHGAATPLFAFLRLSKGRNAPAI